MEGLLFEQGRPNEHLFPCMTCMKPIFTQDMLVTANKPTSTKHRLYWWLVKLTKFWRTQPFVADVALYSFVFFGSMALTLMFFRATRPFVGIFFALSVLIFVLANFVPLSNLPLGCQNAITNTKTKYQGAFNTLLQSSLIIVVFALLIEILYSSFASEDAEETGIKSTTERVLVRVFSTMLFVLPLVAVAYLLVSFYVVERPAYLPINPLYVDTKGESNIDKVRRFMLALPSTNRLKEEGADPNYIAAVGRMQRLWDDRGGYYSLSPFLANEFAQEQ